MKNAQGSLEPPKVASSGQGSLEYLLILGVVILITAIVIGVLTGVLTFGRLEASQEQADSVYTGLQDVIDLSKGRTILQLKLKKGENVLEFNDTVEKTIWTIFQRLPINTQIIFIGAKNCSSISDGQIDANKKIDGQGTAYFQNENGTSTSTIVNQCVVPKDTKVTINVPDTATDEELNLQVPIEKEGEVYLEISNHEDFNAAIWANPSGYFKLTQNINLGEIFLGSISNGMEFYNFAFTGKIIADQQISIFAPCLNGQTVYLFDGIIPINDTTNINLKCNDEDTVLINTQICWNTNSTCKTY